jgi:hypothetical protein
MFQGHMSSFYLGNWISLDTGQQQAADTCSQDHLRRSRVMSLDVLLLLQTGFPAAASCTQYMGSNLAIRGVVSEKGSVKKLPRLL